MPSSDLLTRCPVPLQTHAHVPQVQFYPKNRHITYSSHSLLPHPIQGTDSDIFNLICSHSLLPHPQTPSTDSDTVILICSHSLLLNLNHPPSCFLNKTFIWCITPIFYHGLVTSKMRCHIVSPFSSISSFWSNLRYPRAILIFSEFSQSYCTFKMTPWYLGNRGVGQTFLG